MKGGSDGFGGNLGSFFMLTYQLMGMGCLSCLYCYTRFIVLQVIILIYVLLLLEI
jgi:hypothetical protein